MGQAAHGACHWLTGAGTGITTGCRCNGAPEIFGVNSDTCQVYLLEELIFYAISLDSDEPRNGSRTSPVAPRSKEIRMLDHSVRRVPISALPMA